MDEARLRAISRRLYIDLLKSVAEVFKSLSLSDQEYAVLATIEGEEKLKKALVRGRGAIAYSAHFGNFAIMGGRLARQGFPVHFLLRAPHDPLIRGMLKRAMDSEKLPFFFDDKETVAAKCREVLKNNGVLFMAADQYFAEGSEIQFLGLPTRFTSGPAVLALRWQAALVPVFIYRQSNDRHRIVIEREIDLEGEGSLKQKALTATRDYAARLEGHIRDFPTQWLWLHRRWKNIT